MTGWNPQQPDPGGQRPPHPGPPNPGAQHPGAPNPGAGQPSYGPPAGYPSAPSQSPQYAGNPYGQPPGPAGGPGGYPPRTGGSDPQPKNFFASLFDYSFTSFAGPTLIKVLYILVTIGIALGYLGYLAVAFYASIGLGIAVLIGGAILGLIYLAFARLSLEFFLAVLRMAEDIRALRQERRL